MLDEAAVSYQVVLTKADKIKPHELAEGVEATQRSAENASGRVSARHRHVGGEGRRHR